MTGPALSSQGDARLTAGSFGRHSSSSGPLPPLLVTLASAQQQPPYQQQQRRLPEACWSPGLDEEVLLLQAQILDMERRVAAEAAASRREAWDLDEFIRQVGPCSIVMWAEEEGWWVGDPCLPGEWCSHV